MQGDQRESSVRLAELVAAFSLATDLGLGQPREHVLRSWLIAGRVGERLGLEAGGRESLYYVVTLAWVGCVAETPVVAALFGDDIAFRRDGLSVDRAGLPMLGLALRHMGAGSPVLHRLRLDLSLPTTGRRALVASVRRLRKRQGPLDQGADMSDQAKAMEPEEVTRLIVERLNAGDAAGVAALYEPEAVLAYPADRPTMGRAAIQAVYQQMVDAGMRFGAETPLPTVRFQDLALTSTRSADNTGVRVQLLRRQPDGSWLRIIDRPEVPRP